MSGRRRFLLVTAIAIGIAAAAIAFVAVVLGGRRLLPRLVAPVSTGPLDTGRTRGGAGPHD